MTLLGGNRARYHTTPHAHCIRHIHPSINTHFSLTHAHHVRIICIHITHTHTNAYIIRSHLDPLYYHGVYCISTAYGEIKTHNRYRAAAGEGVGVFKTFLAHRIHIIYCTSSAAQPRSSLADTISSYTFYDALYVLYPGLLFLQGIYTHKMYNYIMYAAAGLYSPYEFHTPSRRCPECAPHTSRHT